MVEGLIRVMEGPEVGPVNLGNPEEVSIMELAGLVKELTKSSSRIIHRELPVDDPVQRCPDIGFAREKYGWAPRVGLREGLLSTIKYFRSAIG
jgi:nucleoside-diphosphate-sugar epimerase